MTENDKQRLQSLANRRPGHLTPEEITWLISLALSLDIEEVRLSVAEEAAKLICLGCRHNLPIEMLDQLIFHITKIGQKEACHAQAIRDHFGIKP